MKTIKERNQTNKKIKELSRSGMMKQNHFNLNYGKNWLLETS